MLGRRSVAYQQRIWELQDRLSQLAAKRQAVEERITNIGTLYARNSITLFQYNQMVQELLQGKTKDDVLSELDRQTFECQQELQRFQTRMAEADSFIVHDSNHHTLNTVFIGVALLFLLGLLLGLSHPTAYVVLP